MLLTLLALHGAALAAVLLFARHDVVLVDDAGPWVAARVPAAAETPTAV